VKHRFITSFLRFRFCFVAQEPEPPNRNGAWARPILGFHGIRTKFSYFINKKWRNKSKEQLGGQDASKERTGKFFPFPLIRPE